MANKKQFKRAFKGASTEAQDTDKLYLDIVHRLTDKYFNLFCSSHEIIGDCVSDELRRYMYRRFWNDGTICLFNIPHTELVGGCQYATNLYDMYNEPATVDCISIVNGQRIPLVPKGTQVVNKDVVIGWYQRNHCSMLSIVDSYVNQLADIEMCINTNLQTHKLPYLFNSTNPDVAARLQTLIQRVLNNEISVGIANGDLNDIQVLSTNTPYIIDKLYTYKCDLENELKTYLGLNNNGVYQKASHTLEAELESSQEDVNDMLDNIDDELNEFSKRIKDTLGKEITFKRRAMPDEEGVPHMPREMQNGSAYKEEDK